METVKSILEILQAGGGWGLSAILMFALYKQSAQKDDLNKELRETLVTSMKELTEAMAQSDQTAQLMVDELREFRNRLLLRGTIADE